MDVEKFARNGQAAQEAVDKLLSEVEKNDQAVSFTVPASGRRYRIWLEDWESICLHLTVVGAAAEKLKQEE